jgi:menaquinone-9 beta-reductase
VAMLPSEWMNKLMPNDPWDVIVVGGGPAGTIAARQLALQSLRVLLVEKASFPRFKVCGGCLGSEALDVLHEVGLGDLPMKAGGVPLRTMRLRCEGSAVELNLRRRVGLSRTLLDSLLLQEAALAGATICNETCGRLEPSDDLQLRSVELRHGEEIATVRAKVVLLATGIAASPAEFVARTWPKSRIGLATLLESGPIDLEPNTLHMACGASGYVGIAPVEEGCFDVAAAVDPAALAKAASPSALVGGILSEAGFPELEELKTASWRGTPLLTKQTRPLGTHRCLLIGDAAEYVEPFTGEGIGWAMRSALLACSLVLEGLKTWDTQIVDRYKMLYSRSLAGRQRRCRMISHLLLRSAFLRRLTLWSLRRAPLLAHSFT